MNCESLSISLTESASTSVREKMLGMIRLRKKFAEMDVESDAINRLTAF